LTAESPASRTKTSSRPTTRSSDGGHPLSPRLNHRLSESTEGGQKDVSAGEMPTFAAKISHTPPEMTIDSHPDHFNFRSLHAALGASRVPEQGRSQLKNAEQAEGSASLFSRALPDLTRKSPQEGQNSSRIPAVDHGIPRETSDSHHDGQEQIAPPKTPPVHLSFPDALKWRREMKIGGSVVGLSNQHILEYVDGRDHVSLKATITNK
jgi:hypothetical protein